MVSIAAKMSVTNLFNCFKDLVRLISYHWLCPFHFSQSVKAIEFPAFLHIEFFEESRPFFLENNPHCILINMFITWFRSNISEKTTVWVMLGTLHYIIAGVTQCWVLSLSAMPRVTPRSLYFEDIFSPL